MSLHKSKQSNEDWGWLRDTESTSSDDISINGIGVVAIHLHRLIINKPFHLIKDNNNQQEINIDTFRICISGCALSRYSKTVRVYSTEKQENIARFDQTMHMIIRIYDKRHDKRHLIHVILYGYLNEEKRYGLIADQVIDSIKLVSVRHISEAVIFESSIDIFGKATLLIELIFVYGRHGYNFSSQLIFQNDFHFSNVVKNQTLFERILPTNEDNTTNEKLFHPPENDLPIFLQLSFDELNQYVANITHNHHSRDLIKNIRVLKALSTSSKYSSMTAIIEMYPSRKQRLDIFFDFLTEGPYLPEQNIIEPTVSRLIPWSITYWKRALSGVPLHGSALDMNKFHNIETGITHLENTSPILRQIIEQEECNTIKLNTIKELVRRVIILFSNLIHH
ncbi:unnamed protein product [Rotaria sordida]|uniref:Uncharacterized protein n=1 Tax=Rotaria sordida TaxID=392033 RepID=A0A814HX47_9BILA|nr:unnamed protein product [Rotaria sordida]CAF1015268.1 unnamed protein product [Rotaria sordida]